MSIRYDYSNKEGKKQLRTRFMKFYIPFFITMFMLFLVDLFKIESDLISKIANFINGAAFIIAFPAFLWHLTLKSQLSNSYVLISDKQIVYNFLKKRAGLGQHADPREIWHEYNLINISEVIIRDTDIVITGNIELVIMHDGKEFSREQLKSLMLPKAFDNMDELVSQLQEHITGSDPW